MELKEKVSQIVELVGGKENIANCIHCATRLRFDLKDGENVKLDEIKKIDGILGAVYQAGQYQVIVGTDVEKYYNEIEKVLVPNSDTGNKVENADNAVKKKGVLAVVLDTLTSILAPTIPAFCAAGMLKVVLLTLSSIGVCTGSEPTYTVFSNISDVAFYFLPLLVAASSAKKFKVSESLALIVAGSLVYPSFVSAVSEGTAMSIFGINIPLYSYSSTIFPALLGVLLLSYVYRLCDKLISYKAFKALLVPLLSICITVPITYLIVAPLGNWGSNILGYAFEWMFNTVGPLAGLVIGFLYPFLVLTGLHQAMSAIQIMEVAKYGYTFCLTIALMHNFAESAAAFGTALATKDKNMKAIATETGFTAFVGVTEPALYSVMVNDKFSMLSAMIGTSAGGFLAMIFKVRGYAYVWPNLFSLPSFIGPESPIWALGICILTTFATAFIMPLIFAKLGFTKFKKNE
ncbi:PTS transporter subunit EIIC [Lacrimispora sp.]|uniref:PTS transporter subunit EIIC n=1 Tax=Lacrimispora sp. TaxID=2719234 RepID=UPI00289745C8|nr:PTS transporter subunit EIIC [Lacrimispora sp.]